jgi:hypothetical protein
MPIAKKHFSQFVLVNILLFIVLSPILRTPYGIDDIYDSVWSYVRVSNGKSLLLDTKEWIYFFLYDLGKFNPISNLMSALTFEIFDTRTSFKLAQLTSTMVMFNLLAYLTYIITNNFRVLILTLFATSILVSFRIEYDGILHYALHQKISNSFIFICLIFLFKSANKNYDFNSYFALCFIFFVLSFLTYETSFLLGVIVIVLRLKYFLRSVSKNLIFVSTFIFMILFKFVVHSNRSEINFQAYNTNGNISDILFLYLKFIFSSLPFSNNLLEVSFLNLSSKDLFYVLLVLIFASIVIYQVLTTPYSAQLNLNSSSNLFNVLAVGLALFFISPVLFAVSKGYSEATSWGEGFHFTILTTSGLILITTYFLHNFNYSKPLYISLFTVIYSLNFAHNLGVTASNNLWATSAKIVGYPREAFFGAVRNGILSDVREPSSILLLPSAPWAENSVLRIESGISDISLTNSWWRFSEKPSSLPSVCPENITICKTSNAHDVLLISALDYRRSYVAFLKSSIFYIPEGYQKRGPLSDADLKIDAATTNARVMFMSGKSCENLHEIALNSGYKIRVERNFDFKVPTYTIVSEDLFWLRRINFDTCS